MKRIFLVLSLFLLVGCSNSSSSSVETRDIKDDITVTLNKETKEKAEEFAKNFTEETSGKMKMSLNEKNNSLDIQYTDDDLNKIVERLANSLDNVETFNSLVVLSQKAQENTDVFKDFDDKISVDLINPKNDNLPLYSIKKDSIEYPASEKAFGGKLPNIISKNMSVILKNANFLFQPKGTSKFNQEMGTIEVNLNLTSEQLEYKNNDTSIKELMKQSAITLYETNESVYSEKYPIILLNDGKELLKIDNGKVIEEKW